MRILVAEDQQVARIILATHLRNWGHQVTETSNGMEALEYITGNPAGVDMLITDWGMPSMDGVELARKVRAMSDASQYVYTILLTGRGDVGDMIKGFSQGGVDDYIVKPFEAAELRLRINVGNRVIRAERTQRSHSLDLEHIVRRQTEAIRETQGEIVSRLFSALESRDEETGSHMRRIGLMSAHLGEALGWGPRRMDAIKAAAPLHDVGKIGIPDMVLRKPGPLTPAEFTIITQHSAIGARILSGSGNPTIQMAEVIARHHHENWDGSGYPDGLQKDAIPIEARVVTIVDVYDALLSDRVYRPGLPESEVLRILRWECGRKFDPDICLLFLDAIDDIKSCCKKEEEGATSILHLQGTGSMLDH